MSGLDLNADLGEGEPATRTHALMRWVGSANVACGGHAGGVATMERAIRSARRHKVRLGAHPGLWSRRGDAGRKRMAMKPGELTLLLLHQVGALARLARHQGVPLHHIKLHGALYHMTETDARWARCYVEAVARWWPRLKIYALARGRVARLAGQHGLTVWEEAFLDRAYLPDGRLVPRTRKGAMLTSSTQVMDRLRMLTKQGVIEAVDGSFLALEPRTLCIHSDTPGAVGMARSAARMLRGVKQ